MKKKILLLFLCMISFNAINAEITWTLSDGTLTISGTGEMPNYSLVNQNQPWSSKKSTIKKVIIENGVTNIGKYTFYNYSNLTTITIPKSVTSIGGFAFAYCKSLTSITIPNSVTSIGGGAFNGCGLTSITIPNSVTTIDDYTFYDCKDLTSITIPNSVTKIGEMAFCGCSALTSITIPKSVTNINIGSGIFSKCSSLNSITVEKGNTKYDSRDDCNAIIETKTNTLIASCNNTIIPNSVTTIGSFAFGDSNRTSITIPATITDIRIRAFCGCSDLTFVTVEEGNTIYDSREKCNAIIETKSNSLIVGCRNTVIPSSVTSISNWAFEWCKSLTSISIPNSVTSIGINAFSGCLGLTSISIPNSVTSIGINAFSYCSGLTSITCEAITPPDCGSSCFYDINKSIPVYVAANNVDAYKTANLWKDFTNIQAIPTTYTLTDGELYNVGSQRKECEISYTRSFNNTSWQALYIPFSMSYDNWKNDFEIAYINGVRQLDKNDDGIIDETIMDVIKIKSGSTTPNMPYLIKAKTTGEKTFSVSNTTLYPAEENSVDCSTTIAKYTFTGTYNAIPSATMIANGYYAMGGGDLIQSDGSNDLKPYRWYMKVESRNPSYNASNAAKTITINVLDEESETTGVEELQMANDESPVYDLNGRKVNENNLKPGIYVKNGKKFIVK
ncbi:MAG: leucine-rich repeat domain-containing protein [Prevotella sp.]|nr:leucine-rich repeat domain-containing protein [Prevotella sp.]